MQKESVEKGSIWQHFKGDLMEVVMVACNSETLEDMIIYRHREKIWARPISSFLSSEDVSARPDNKTGQKYRFIKMK